MTKENKEEKKFKVTQIFTNKRYYAIANLIFYSIVILALIISVRTNPTTGSSNSINNNTQGIQIEGFESIKNKNFNFRYIVKTNKEEIVYEGKQRDEKIMFVNQLDKKEYYKQNKIILEKTEDDYVLSTMFEIYFDFFDVDLINDILKASTFEDGEYFISNKDFSEKVGFSKTDDTLYGVYIQIIKQNRIITGLEFDVSEINSNVKTITLQYQNYGLIEDFDIK